MMMQKIMTSSLLFLGLLGLTACPSNSSQDRAPLVAPNQGQGIPGGNNPNNPGGYNPGGNNPNNPGGQDWIMKGIQCEFEGQRTKNYKYGSINMSIPKTIALISFDSRYETPIDLRTKFLGVDIGKFGKISLQFVPADKTKSGTDTIILIDEGLNKNTRMSQSGFAGQEVKLVAQDEGLFVTVACKGTSQFKSGISHTGKTKLVCHGKSSTALTSEEQIDITIPLSSIQPGEEFVISEAVSAKLDNAATTITYMGSLDPGYAPIVTSTASLKSSATFKIVDTAKEQNSLAQINVTCKIQ